MAVRRIGDSRATRLRLPGHATAVAAILLAGLLAGANAAEPSAPALTPLRTDLSALPHLGETWAAENPYAGNSAVVATGRSLYLEICARCHGDEASQGAPAPDLRRLDRYCRRIADEKIKRHCSSDVDDYFRRSVLFGKIRLGIEHMPAWQDRLSQEAVWAIRTYVAARPVNRR